MDYKEKVIALLNSQELSQEQKEKLENIFPELAKSDDERIRKEILEYFQQFENEELRGVNISDWIAWLEKKSEQKPEWSEEDVEIVEALNDYVKNLDILFSEIKIGNKDILSKEFREKVQLWLKYIKDRVQPQPKQEWSKDDETFLNTIISDLDYSKSIHNKAKCNFIDKEINWLKSLKNRYIPQSKQELSEEDKTNIDSLLDVLFRIKKGKDPQATTRLIEQHINFIKSLREIYTWKPSAFHLECIEDAINLYEKHGINAIGLKEILDELKKLKG